MSRRGSMMANWWCWGKPSTAWPHNSKSDGKLYLRTDTLSGAFPDAGGRLLSRGGGPNPRLYGGRGLVEDKTEDKSRRPSEWWCQISWKWSRKRLISLNAWFFLFLSVGAYSSKGQKRKVNRENSLCKIFRGWRKRSDQIERAEKAGLRHPTHRTRFGQGAAPCRNGSYRRFGPAGGHRVRHGPEPDRPLAGRNRALYQAAHGEGGGHFFHRG